MDPTVWVKFQSQGRRAYAISTRTPPDEVSRLVGAKTTGFRTFTMASQHRPSTRLKKQYKSEVVNQFFSGAYTNWFIALCYQQTLTRVSRRSNRCTTNEVTKNFRATENACYRASPPRQGVPQPAKRAPLVSCPEIPSVINKWLKGFNFMVFGLQRFFAARLAQRLTKDRIVRNPCKPYFHKAYAAPFFLLKKTSQTCNAKL